MIGLCFISIGLAIQLSDVLQMPGLIIGGAVLIILSKFVLSLTIARYYQNSWRTSTLTAVSLAQGGEFAFVLLTIAVTHTILDISLLSPLLCMLALSMLITPVLYWLLDQQILPRLNRSHHLVADFDTQVEPLATTPILLIGFGRFGQIVARVLHQQGLSFSVMDNTVEASELLKDQSIPFFQADATETTALQLADIASKDQVIVAIDDIEDSLLVVRHLCWNYPVVDSKMRHYAFANGENGVTRLPLLLQLPEERNSFNMQSMLLALNYEFMLSAKAWGISQKT